MNVTTSTAHNEALSQFLKLTQQARQRNPGVAVARQAGRQGKADATSARSSGSSLLSAYRTTPQNSRPSTRTTQDTGVRQQKGTNFDAYA